MVKGLQKEKRLHTKSQSFLGGAVGASTQEFLAKDIKYLLGQIAENAGSSVTESSIDHGKAQRGPKKPSCESSNADSVVILDKSMASNQFYKSKLHSVLLQEQASTARPLDDSRSPLQSSINTSQNFLSGRGEPLTLHSQYVNKPQKHKLKLNLNKTETAPLRKRNKADSRYPPEMIDFENKENHDSSSEGKSSHYRNLKERECFNQNSPSRSYFAQLHQADHNTIIEVVNYQEEEEQHRNIFKDSLDQSWAPCNKRPAKGTLALNPKHNLSSQINPMFDSETHGTFVRRHMLSKVSSDDVESLLHAELLY
jgi:hypothetical protein